MAPVAIIGLVGLGGMCGSISRYLIQNIASVQTDRFYLTLAINIAGSLATVSYTHLTLPTIGG